jgi:hypothetical protein
LLEKGCYDAVVRKPFIVVEQRGLVDDARQTPLGRRGESMKDMFVGLLARFSNPLIYAAPNLGVVGSLKASPFCEKS